MPVKSSAVNQNLSTSPGGELKNSDMQLQPGSVKLHPLARENIIAGENREAGVGPRSLIKLDIEDQFKAMELVREVHSFLTNAYTGKKDISLFAQIVMDKFDKWDNEAKKLALIELELLDKKKFKAGKKEFKGSKGFMGQRIRWGRQSGEEYDEIVSQRREKIKRVLSIDKDTSDQEAKSEREKLISELRKEFKNISNGLNLDTDLTGFEAMLQAYQDNYEGTEIQYIFNAKDLYQVEQFLEYTEQAVLMQAGKDILDPGHREITFDLSKIDVDVLIKEGIPPRQIQAIEKIKKAIGFKNIEDLQDALTTLLAMGGGSVIGIDVALLTAIGVNSPLWASLAMSGAGAVGGAAYGLAATLVSRLITRKIRHWYYNLPPESSEINPVFTIDLKD